MADSAQAWNDGDIITAEKMNALQTAADTANATATANKAALTKMDATVTQVKGTAAAAQGSADAAGTSVSHLIAALGITGELGDTFTDAQLAAIKSTLGIAASA